MEAHGAFRSARTWLDVVGGWRSGRRKPASQGRAFTASSTSGPYRAGDLILTEPDFFGDLNLDQVRDSLTGGRESYQLEHFFDAPLRDPDVVRYRHEVLRDLEEPDVLTAIRAFAQAMERMRGHLEQVEKLHYELQKQSWFVDAVEIYREGVRALAADLQGLALTSRGLCGLRGYLRDYVGSASFGSLVDETRAVKEALAAIRYSVRIQGARVTVTRYEGAGDYSAEVLDTFARFQQGAVGSYRVSLRDEAGMNHIEAQILDGVARLHPDVFGARANYCKRHADFLDVTVWRFDREVQFYVAYLELVERLRAAGLPFCYPQVSASDKESAVSDTFDVALARKLVDEHRDVVCNDFSLRGPERMFVVSGPNNGGKTTFARTFGQLHYLASLGLLVPGSEARLFLPDRISMTPFVDPLSWVNSSVPVNGSHVNPSIDE